LGTGLNGPHFCRTRRRFLNGAFIATCVYTLAIVPSAPSAWENTLRRRVASMASFREVTRDGLALLGADKTRAARIKAADDVYAWAEKFFAAAPPCPSAQPRFEAALNGRKQRSKS
jgi:hypothetical protein